MITLPLNHPYLARSDTIPTRLRNHALELACYPYLKTKYEYGKVIISIPKNPGKSGCPDRRDVAEYFNGHLERSKESIFQLDRQRFFPRLGRGQNDIYTLPLSFKSNYRQKNLDFPAADRYILNKTIRIAGAGKKCFIIRQNLLARSFTGVGGG